MKIAFAIIASSLVASATPPPDTPPGAAAGKRCILPSRVAAPVVRDDGRVYFRGQPDSGRSYLAVFKGGRCPGLNRFAVVAIETSGTGYCEGDRIRSLNPPSTIPGPACVIDHFQPFDGEVDDPAPAPFD